MGEKKGRLFAENVISIYTQKYTFGDKRDF